MTPPPRPVAGLEFHGTGGASAPPVTVYNPGTGRYARLGPAPTRLLQLCDGKRSMDELCRLLDLPPGDPDLETELARLAAAGLVESDGHASSSAPSTSRSWSWRGLHLSVPSWMNPRLTVVRPEAVFERARPALERVLSVPVVSTAAGVVIAAAAFVYVSRPLLGETVPRGLFSREMVIAGFLSWIFLGLHELAHGAVLARFGGRVRGIGVMLFYFRPALFVDANDAWVLPSRWQRFWVAAAGIVVHVVAAVGLLALVAGSQRLEPTVAFWERLVTELAIINVALAAFNLIPFVKLDGYWMVASAIDRPSLRAEAMAAARRAVGRGTGPRRSIALTLFGAVSAASGTVFTIAALTMTSTWLLARGPIGLVVWLGGCVVGAGHLARMGVRRAAQARMAARGAGVLDRAGGIANGRARRAREGVPAVGRP